MEGLAKHEAETDVHADHRHAPDAETDELVARVGEPVARRADEVGRGGHRGDAEVRDVVPVVGPEREEREQRNRKHEESDDPAARAGFRFRGG